MNDDNELVEVGEVVRQAVDDFRAKIEIALDEVVARTDPSVLDKMREMLEEQIAQFESMLRSELKKRAAEFAERN